MAIGQRDRGDMPFIWISCGSIPLLRKKPFSSATFIWNQKHAHSGIGKRDFARFGTVPQSACLKTRTITATVRSRLLMWCAAFEKNFYHEGAKHTKGWKDFRGAACCAPTLCAESSVITSSVSPTANRCGRPIPSMNRCSCGLSGTRVTGEPHSCEPRGSRPGSKIRLPYPA